MDNQNILSEDTLKLKTKVLVFAGVSLFIGLTKVLPTKLSLIGLNFNQNEKVVGWFLLVITISLFINFIIIASLNIIKYFKYHLIQRKARTLTGNTIGLTYDEIGKAYDSQHEYYDEEQGGSLSDEADDIKRKIKTLEDKFDKNHISFNNIIEILFNFLLPIILAIISIKYLYSFLVIS